MDPKVKKVLQELDPNRSGRRPELPIPVHLPEGINSVDKILQQRIEAGLLPPEQQLVRATGQEQVTICRVCGCVSVVGEKPTCNHKGN